MEKQYQINEFTNQVRQDKKSLRTFSKNAKGSGTKNLVMSGAAGIGMGILGVGIPDIPVFTGMILKSIYEIAMHYGYTYETEEEQYFIFLLIQGAVTHGEELYMKFLQGIPIVGTVGGAYDVIYLKQIIEYANLKYERRFLESLGRKGY